MAQPVRHRRRIHVALRRLCRQRPRRAIRRRNQHRGRRRRLHAFSTDETASFTVAVSAAVGTNGTGTKVDLSSEFNLNGIYTDATTYATGGLDGTGYSYSSNLLTPSRVFNGTLLDFGPANQLDAVGCSGQVVSLTQGKFSSLRLLATGVEGNQESQVFTVTYTDGTT